MEKRSGKGIDNGIIDDMTLPHPTGCGSVFYREYRYGFYKKCQNFPVSVVQNTKTEQKFGNDLDKCAFKYYYWGINVLEQVQMEVHKWVLQKLHRRPVWVGPRLGLQDLQGGIPRAWCVGCGTELFFKGRLYCKRCEKEEKYEKKRKSLRRLHPGAESCGV